MTLSNFEDEKSSQLTKTAELETGIAPRLQKVAPVRIFEQAVQQLRELILTGQLLPGDRLPTEQVLCRQLSISRSTVREALRVLEAEGLVEVRRGMGTYVIEQPTVVQPAGEVRQWIENHREAIEQVLQVRESIETTTACLAAQRANSETLEELEKVLLDQNEQIAHIRRSGEENYDRLALLDAAFHMAVASASGNDLMVEVISHILPAFNQSNKAVLYVTGQMDTMATEHHSIVAAIQTGDCAAAAQAMRLHIQRVKETVMAER